MNNPSYIEVQVNEDGMFGEEPEGYDVFSSFIKFEGMVNDEIKKSYPDSRVLVDVTPHVGSNKTKSDSDDPSLIEEVDSIIQSVWSDWNWLVTL